MLEYQKQNSSLTLAEGLAEYFSVNNKHFKSRKMTPAAEAFFKNHDVAHVVFGCDISLNHELIVKLSSMFGTTEGFGVFRGYKLAESKETYAELGVKNIFLTIAHSLVLAPRTIWRCIHMPDRWVWDKHDDYLKMPLNQIRTQFGIRVPD